MRLQRHPSLIMLKSLVTNVSNYYTIPTTTFPSVCGGGGCCGGGGGGGLLQCMEGPGFYCRTCMFSK